MEDGNRLQRNDWAGDGSSHASVCLIKLLLSVTSDWPFLELPTGIIITR